MRDWIIQNKQWLFSGAGISIIAALWWSLKRVFHRDPKPVPPTNNSVVQAPVISVAPVFNLPNSASPPEEPTPSPRPQSGVSDSFLTGFASSGYNHHALNPHRYAHHNTPGDGGKARRSDEPRLYRTRRATTA